ncbi:thioesterase II family protein [Actinoplanes sp. NPDC051859]|uniref:thioesterase II family protein n=1 Tax=Actinoplanes sp. NPDC051859 TaxID=3363909 RepID=UPI0037AC9341
MNLPVRLFCLPHAGGDARIFGRWSPYLRRGIELHPLDRAGQGSRVAEPPSASWEAAVADLATRITAAVDGPWALYGHSMGGLLGYELLCRLAETLPPPRWFFVGGCRPPQLGRRHPVLHELPDREFLTALSELGGIPPELLGDEDLVAYFAAGVRADFRQYEQYVFRPREVRPACPLTAFVGSEDPITDPAEAARWAELMAGPVAGTTLAGAGHFLVVERPAEIVAVINSVLGPTAPGPAG